jgi:cytidine deaminase
VDFVLNNELISNLVNTAKKYADNAYCPYSNRPVGAAVLCGENAIFGGCNIESGDYSSPSLSAGVTAIAKAVSEGYSDLIAICLYSVKMLPYPNAITREMLCEFNDKIKIIVATEERYEIIDSLSSIYLFAPAVDDMD